LDILDGLTPAQLEAVTHSEGPLLVLAGAGSGKTRVITRRIAYLVNEGVPPWNILAITFTNKAAQEMRSRVEDLVGEGRIEVSTFHSFAARVLRRYAEAVGVSAHFTIYDEADATRVIKGILAELKFDTTHWKPEALQATISLAKNRLEDVEDFRRRRSGYAQEVTARVYARYRDYMIDHDALDFDDLLMKLVRLMQSQPEILQELRDEYRYLLIDEYQDTNQAQYLIARLLVEESRNLTATGDPDQSIYGWRGASIENILRFERDFPDAKVVRLEENFRSTRVILRAATSLISHNRRRKEKALWTKNSEGPRIRCIRAYDEQEEASLLARRIREYIEEGHSPRDIAVFYRINSLSRVLETALLREHIPYTIVAGTEFYQRKEIKEILAYLKVANNLKDDVSFLRAVNSPPRGIGKKTINLLKSLARSRNLSLMEATFQPEELSDLPESARKKLSLFRDIVLSILDLPQFPVKPIVQRALEISGYEKTLEKSESETSKERLENLRELLSAAHRYDLEHPEGSLQGFLEEIALVADVDKWDRAAEAVSLLTLHSAKGLEFPVVFIVAFEEGILPHDRALDEGRDEEEERRLAFVGITRAKKELHISYADQRTLQGRLIRQSPSRFLSEIPEDLFETVLGPSLTSGRWQVTGRTSLPYDVGDVVRSPYFGMGKVVEISPRSRWTKVVVEFERGLRRNLIAEYASLKKVSSPGA